MNVIPTFIDSAFHAKGVDTKNIVEASYKILYLTPFGNQCNLTKNVSILDKYFFPLMLEERDELKECILLLRYKRGEQLKTLSLSLTGLEELFNSYLWLKNVLFCEKMEGKHEFSSWCQDKIQEELADCITKDTIDVTDFKYPLRVSKTMVNYNDLAKAVSCYAGLYNQKEYEFSKSRF